jgi:hypothetical protein
MYLDIRELAPHAAFGHCAKSRAEIKFDVTQKPSQPKVVGSKDKCWWVGEEISFLLQLLCARREKCGKSEWSWSDGRKNGSPRLRIDQIPIWMKNTASQIPERALNSHKHRRNPAKTL